MIRLQFDSFPFLFTERFVLRPLLMSDAEQIFQLRSSDTVNRYIGRAKARSISDAEAHIAMLIARMQEHKVICWVIADKSESFAGSVMYWNIDYENAEAEIGYELLPAWQGNGVMQEVLPVVIDFGFREMNIRKIVADPHRENIKSVKLLEANGFTRDRSLTEGDFVLYTLNNLENSV